MPFTLWPWEDAQGNWRCDFWFGDTFFSDRLHIPGNIRDEKAVIAAAEDMGPIIYGPKQQFQVMKPRFKAVA